MSPLPQLIPLTDLDVSVRPAGLLELAAGELGNAGGPSDGFETAFNDIAVFLGTAPAVADGLDTEFSALAGAGPLPDPATLDADVLAFPADLATGDAVLRDLGALLTPQTVTPPAVPVGEGVSAGGPAPPERHPPPIKILKITDPCDTLDCPPRELGKGLV